MSQEKRWREDGRLKRRGADFRKDPSNLMLLILLQLEVGKFNPCLIQQSLLALCFSSKYATNQNISSNQNFSSNNDNNSYFVSRGSKISPLSKAICKSLGKTDQESNPSPFHWRDVRLWCDPLIIIHSARHESFARQGLSPTIYLCNTYVGWSKGATAI